MKPSNKQLKKLLLSAAKYTPHGVLLRCKEEREVADSLEAEGRLNRRNGRYFLVKPPRPLFSGHRFLAILVGVAILIILNHYWGR